MAPDCAYWTDCVRYSHARTARLYQSMTAHMFPITHGLTREATNQALANWRNRTSRWCPSSTPPSKTNAIGTQIISAAVCANQFGETISLQSFGIPFSLMTGSSLFSAVLPWRPGSHFVAQDAHALIVRRIEPEHPVEDIPGFVEPRAAPQTQPVSVRAGQEGPVVEIPSQPSSTIHGRRRTTPRPTSARTLAFRRSSTPSTRLRTTRSS